jgi:hypothetical protein
VYLLAYEKKNRGGIYWLGEGGLSFASNRCGGGSGILGASTRALVLVLLILSVYLVREFGVYYLDISRIPMLRLLRECQMSKEWRRRSSIKVGSRCDAF